MANDTLIEFSGVQKAFGEKVVYRDLSLDVRRGECLAIVGGSGTGKSVMLRLLIGLLRADAGSIVFDDDEITAMSEEQLEALRSRIAMMFQGSALFDSMTVADNVAYPLREQQSLPEEEIAARVQKNLGLVGLPDSGALMPAALSGGMKKRVALARAIITKPEVILLDEPTAGLDPVNTRMVDDLVKSLQQELAMTVMIVTHDLPTVYQLADRVAMVHEGRILATLQTPEFQNSQVPEIRAFVSAMDPCPADIIPISSARVASKAR